MSTRAVSTRTANVSDWSHSTVYTRSYTTPLPDVNAQNFPPLTTPSISASGCADRWMLSSLSGTSLALSLKRDVAPMDQQYASCQPYGVVTIYSPGICPQGQTLAEITQHEAQAATGGLQKYWAASCCPSGMTFGPDWSAVCYSSFSTPFRVFAPMTLRVVNATTSTVLYVAVTAITSGGSPVASTFSDIHTISEGIAVARPIILGWQEKDLRVFPTDYSSSLARKLGLSVQATDIATPATSSRLPQSTASTSPSHSPGTSLSGREQAGIAIGTIAGVIFLISALTYLVLFRRRRRRGPISVGESSVPVAEMEDQTRSKSAWRWLVGGRWRSETEARTCPQELTAVRDPLELDSKAMPKPLVELEGESVRRGSGDGSVGGKSRERSEGKKGAG